MVVAHILLKEIESGEKAQSDLYDNELKADISRHCFSIGRGSCAGLPASTDVEMVAEQALGINSARERSSLRNKIQKQNRGSAVPLRGKGYPLKLHPILS